MHAFFYGTLLALGLIMPLGMQNSFIFSQGVTQKKWRHTLPSVLTAFTCDTLLILCAVTGVSFIVFSIPIIKNIVYLLGIVFLIYMGCVTWRNSSTAAADVNPLSSKQQMAFATSVSLLNPHAILDSVAVIGTNSLSFIGAEKWIYTTSCIFVSLTWFLTLSILGHFFKRMDDNGKILRWLSKVSSFTVWGAALYLGHQFITSVNI